MKPNPTAKAEVIIVSVLICLLAGWLVIRSFGGVGSAAREAGADSAGVSKETVELARSWLDAHEYIARPFDGLSKEIGDAEAIANVHVVGIEGPLFNSKTGESWEGSDVVPPDVYSIVHVELAEQLSGKTTLPKTFDLFVGGDATARFESREQPPYGSLSGGFVIGENHIVFLKQDTLLTENGTLDVWNLSASYLGNWRLEGQQAVGSDLELSMAIDALTSKVTETDTGTEPSLEPAN